MKTLVVLSALVAVALAAPLQEESDIKKTNTPEIFKRERKSLPQESTDSKSPLETQDQPSTPQVSEFGISGRSFALKKPIIIKKKHGHGYHVYRDSDEEQIESGESCGKQVKVKLCDVKSKDKMRSLTIEDVDAAMTEDEMKQSIKLVKEAVENLQRDFKTAEHQPGSIKHEHSESDADLHQDIEVAREALEHIHKNFENLESMSLHAAKLEDADTVHDDLNIAKNEEQRLAQWKEAIDNIQKNVEIAKNIEDSFKDKSAKGDNGLLLTEDSMTQNNNHKLTDFMRTTDDLVQKNSKKLHSKTCKPNLTHEKFKEKIGDKPRTMEDDMTSSASTMSEKKIEELHKSNEARHTPEVSTEPLKLANSLANSAKKEHEEDMGRMTSQDLSKKDVLVPDSLKIDETKERKTDAEKEGSKLLLKPTNIVSAHEMKNVESEDMVVELQRNAAATTENQQAQTFLKHESKNKMEEESKHQQIKSAEVSDTHIDNSNKHEAQIDDKQHQHKEVDSTKVGKSAEATLLNQQNILQSVTDIMHDERLKRPKANLQHEPKMAQQEMMKQQMEKMAPNTNVEHKAGQQIQSHMHSDMRTAEDIKTTHHHHHQPADLPQTRWAEDKHLHLQDFLKSANGIQAQAMEHAHNLQHAGNLHRQAHSNHFNTPNGHEHHSQFPDNFMPQGKSADMDLHSYYMMRDGSGLGPENHRFRWKPSHEAARSAYGAPAPAAVASPPSGSAVGVFHNANVGGCGIPLLLSCNPSVVSGSLSKHPAPYSPPAYRTEDEFSFHTKRDVKKTQDNLTRQQHITPTTTHTKTSTVLVANQ